MFSKLSTALFILVGMPVICWRLWVHPEALYWIEKLVLSMAMLLAALRLYRDDFARDDEHELLED